MKLNSEDFVWSLFIGMFILVIFFAFIDGMADKYDTRDCLKLYVDTEHSADDINKICRGK